MESEEERRKRIESECQPLGMIAGTLLSILLNHEDPSGLKIAVGFAIGWVAGLFFCLKVNRYFD
jgi:hypothetical protein